MEHAEARGPHERNSSNTFTLNGMARRQRQASWRQENGKQRGERQAQPLRVMPSARSVHGAATAVSVQKSPAKRDVSAKPSWPPVPDLFDVITYFRARGDCFPLIASIGFWTTDCPSKALTARNLKLWYEGELEKRAEADNRRLPAGR